MTILILYFNSIKVRLEHIEPLVDSTSVPDFNSIKVRLEQLTPSSVVYSDQFQFHKGTIRTSIKTVQRHRENINFNSIKVRLEPKGGTADAPTLRFQFHKGTIRTESSIWFWVLMTKFQFHKGTIRTPRQSRPPCPGTNFNSIKVRLEP